MERWAVRRYVVRNSKILSTLTYDDWGIVWLVVACGLLEKNDTGGRGEKSPVAASVTGVEEAETLTVDSRSKSLTYSKHARYSHFVGHLSNPTIS